LQGDVGSGKTLVAFFACLEVIDRGFQCAFLAPTELLARQHAENAAKLFAALDIKLAFLTGNLKASGRGNLLNALKNGEIDLVIGTHALFSQSTAYKNLGFVIIDEQHRFGVAQRNAMLSKCTNRNLLMMSATPIPQTLALTIFSDMDISVIRSMPAGRLPVKTHLAEEGKVQKVYDFVRRELNEGHQAYFVYPLISDSDEGKMADLKSAEQMYKELSREFPDKIAALIHSEIDEEAQKNIMADFRANKIHILVATSVIEVGVDVPNATCIVVEHSERFGLAALHQLRGRVGRGNLQSHCFLVYDTGLTEIAKKRLKVLFESNDGFFVAEQDLILRGPGEVLGLQQSGYMNFTIADPVRDKDIMLIARKAALENLRES
ncbi:MAG: ATP-dependent DNA helicase RecG, partial [Spirochaetaceae bacterium]|nr:ATP-dependent DNA helicase RecG [Spirochaetaceae bacterium]